ncbi:hypothetical protein BDY21DRAFT_363423 [Lineolata rhizophorae]|uniref:Uncharacterized protein n=1 Tax=Lineolata rhizophorae TaxID=578093 RepID=A0A6A6P1W3_9PEZI|nr:hypothetical protein BDY21DRAFT_363423 [Lineolata rhizophorae]
MAAWAVEFESLNGSWHRIAENQASDSRDDVCRRRLRLYLRPPRRVVSEATLARTACMDRTPSPFLHPRYARGPISSAEPQSCCAKRPYARRRRVEVDVGDFSVLILYTTSIPPQSMFHVMSYRVVFLTSEQEETVGLSLFVRTMYDTGRSRMLANIGESHPRRPVSPSRDAGRSFNLVQLGRDVTEEEQKLWQMGPSTSWCPPPHALTWIDVAFVSFPSLTILDGDRLQLGPPSLPPHE